MKKYSITIQCQKCGHKKIHISNNLLKIIDKSAKKGCEKCGSIYSTKIHISETIDQKDIDKFFGSCVDSPVEKNPFYSKFN